MSKHGSLIQDFLAGKDIDLVPVVQDVVANLPDAGIDIVVKFLDSYSGQGRHAHVWPVFPVCLPVRMNIILAVVL